VLAFTLYKDEDFFALEVEKIFMRTWQLVCHVSNIPKSGDYFTFDLLGEMVFVVRGDDGEVRAFHNVCRHRAGRLLDGPSGQAKHIKCPYHAWRYDLQGNLKNVPFERDFAELKKEDHGLKPVEMEIFAGFIFICFKPAAQSVVDIFQPYLRELEPYRLEKMVPMGRVTMRSRKVNWKIAIDNYVDALHIEVAHPGLNGLFGNTYSLEVNGGVHKMWGDVVPTNKETWSVKMYKKHLPIANWLPKEAQRRWVYYRLWPNLTFDIYPEQMDFMQFLPVTATTMMIREISYTLADPSREMKAAQYLNWRINRQVNAEDHRLIAGVQAGMATSAFTKGPLAKREICLIDAAKQLRKAIPVAQRDTKPGMNEMKQLLDEARLG